VDIEEGNPAGPPGLRRVRHYFNPADSILEISLFFHRPPGRGRRSGGTIIT